jgi:hypothetical protein
MSKHPPAQGPNPLPPEPIDVVDGIPDRAARTPRWRYVLLAAAGLAWVAVLIYCWLAGCVEV